MKTRGALLANILAASAASLVLAGGTAVAQSGAPIVYKTPDAPQSQPRAGQGANAPTAAPQAAAGRPRIEFRYPDQPDLVYSDAGVRASDSSAPIAFSSSTSAISERDARQYASVEAPMAARQPVALDPAISPGGFDARATAERIAAQAALPPHRSAAATPAPESYSTPGETMRPANIAAFEESGPAGLYDASFQGLETANGEIFDNDRLSAAHPTLPLPSLVQVTNQSNGREIVVRVNDRGPFEEGRIIDLSQRAGDLLGIETGRAANVQVRYLGPANVANGAAPSGVNRIAVTQFDMPDMPEYTPASSPAPAPAPAPTPAPVRAPAPASQQDRGYPSADVGFFVQVGSFSNIGNAQRLRASLDASLFVEVVPVRLNGADYFRVLVGPYQNRSQAEHVRNDLSYRGVAQGMVVSKR
ncbi:MAG: septal ring lytic transglycosylase RlpA family protein [Pseudomonadota bacterium]